MAQRIHKDLAKLFKAPPPDCILDTEDDDDDSSLADPEPSIGLALPGRSTGLGMSSLSTISFYLLGPESTAFYGGAWRVKLKIPSEYPRKAPAAYFVTKIFHPNVQPSTGEVCVDTLKRDWRPDVDLAQIILTIRCLLIQPNPESSLNEEAGKLMLDDYAAFERMARVMTKVHSIPRADILKKFNLDDSPLVEEPMKKIEAPNSTTTTTTTTTTASTVKPDMLPVKEDIEMVDGKGFQDSIIITNNNKENGGAGTTNSGLSSPLILSATCSTGQDLQMIQTQSSAQTSSVLLPRDERDTNNITNNSGINSSSPLFPASKESSFNGLCTSLTPPSSSSSSSSNSLTKAPPSPLSPTMGPAPAYSPTAGTSPTTVSSSLQHLPPQQPQSDSASNLLPNPAVVVVVSQTLQLPQVHQQLQPQSASSPSSSSPSSPSTSPSSVAKPSSHSFPCLLPCNASSSGSIIKKKRKLRTHVSKIKIGLKRL